MPADCKRLLAFRDQGSCIPGIFVDVPFFRGCGCAQQNLNPLVRALDINGRWANFIGQVPDGTKIDISYQKVWTDDDGNVIINEEAYTAITNYVAYQFATAYAELYTPEQRREWKELGVWGGARVRSAAARRKFEQDRVQIHNLMIQMVNGDAPLGIISGAYSTFLYPTIRSISV